MLVWQRNPDLDKNITFVDDPSVSFNPSVWDLDYEMTWNIDKAYNPLDEDVWAFKCRVKNARIKGSKYMGSVTPTFPEPKIIYNSDLELSNLDFDIDLEIPWYDLKYEHVWMLDSRHTKNAPEPIWAVKVRYTDAPSGTKIVGTTSPTPRVEFNPDLPQLDFDIDLEIPWYDLKYEHVWMLDSRHTKNAPEPIWAVKIRYTDTPSGTKIVGTTSPTPIIEINPDVEYYDIDTSNIDIQYHDFEYTTTLMLDKTISGDYDIWAIKINYVDKPIGYKVDWTVYPKQYIEYNDALKHLNIKIDYPIPFHDSQYVHTWYLDKSYGLGDNIWAVKTYTSIRASGEKNMGVVTPIISDKLDVVFISYNEPNAEDNWKRLLDKAPWAKRIDKVKGIFNAHRAAAELSTTDMFYVVDGDAYIVDDFNFNFQPSIFDRDCSYVWHSINPINDLVYENGGVKLFSKKELLKVKKWKTLDMFTGISLKIKVQDQISCITQFNSTPFDTWRSAFRECVKLFEINKITILNKWMTKGKKKEFGMYSIDGAKAGYEYAKKYSGNTAALSKINDYKWLKEEFERTYDR